VAIKRSPGMDTSPYRDEAVYVRQENARLKERVAALESEREDIITRLTYWAKGNDHERTHGKRLNFLNPHTVLDWMAVSVDERTAHGCMTQEQLERALSGEGGSR
jgi:hypothetical protein